MWSKIHIFFILGNVPERSKGSDLRSGAYASWVRIPSLPHTYIYYFIFTCVAQLDRASDF